MLYNELTISFPWYEKIEHQDRYRENAERACDYKLITPRDALLPFQFVKPTPGAPIMWEIFEANSQQKVADVTQSIAFLRMSGIEGKKYWTYDGRQLLTAPATPLSLPAGFYYSRLTWADSQQWFSEMFFVPDVDQAFNIADDDNANFVKLVWYNDNDLRPIFYNDKQVSGVPYFRNVAYLDTFITASEPEIVEDGERDGHDELIITFQKAIIKYRITLPVAEYLKKAMSLLNMHDHVILTTHRSIRSGELEKLTFSSVLEANGAFSIVDLLFQETILVKKGCGENMTFA